MASVDNQKIRLALWFSVKRDLRFLSHRDTSRLMQKALSRSRIPVRYSRGFNPHMHLSLPLPRSVNMSSRKELLLVDLLNHHDIPTLIEQLQKQLPAGLKILTAYYAPPQIPTRPRWSRYQMILNSQVEPLSLNARVKTFMQSSAWSVERPAHGRHQARKIDLRAGLTELELNRESLFCTIQINPEGTPRIDEILNALEINNSHLVREIIRIDVKYPEELNLKI